MTAVQKHDLAWTAARQTVATRSAPDYASATSTAAAGIPIVDDANLSLESPRSTPLSTPLFTPRSFPLSPLGWDIGAWSTTSSMAVQ
jgi:hypothetical protein